MKHLHVVKLRNLDEVVIGGGGRIGADPELARMKVSNDGGKSADVVGMRVRQGDGIEMVNATRPQIGRDHVVAYVEIGIRESGGPTRVNEQRFSFWTHDQDGVALAYVDGGD